MWIPQQLKILPQRLKVTSLHKLKWLQVPVHQTLYRNSTNKLQQELTWKAVCSKSYLIKSQSVWSQVDILPCNEHSNDQVSSMTQVCFRIPSRLWKNNPRQKIQEEICLDQHPNKVRYSRKKTDLSLKLANFRLKWTEWIVFKSSTKR